MAATAASQQAPRQQQEPTDWRQAFAASAKYQAQSRPADVFAQFTAGAGAGLSLAAVGTVAEPKPSPLVPATPATAIGTQASPIAPVAVKPYGHAPMGPSSELRHRSQESLNPARC